VALAAGDLSSMQEPLAYAAGYGGGGYDGAVMDAGSGEPGQNRILLFGAAAAGLLLVAFAGAMVARSFDGGDGGGAPAATETAEGGVGEPTNTPGVALESPTPGGETSTPTAEPTDTPPPSATAAPPTATAVPASPTSAVSPTRTGTPTRTLTPTRTVRPTQTPRPTRTP
jgi:hypothetical protein